MRLTMKIQSFERYGDSEQQLATGMFVIRTMTVECWLSQYLLSKLYYIRRILQIRHDNDNDLECVRLHSHHKFTYVIRRGGPVPARISLEFDEFRNQTIVIFR